MPPPTRMEGGPVKVCGPSSPYRGRDAALQENAIIIYSETEEYRLGLSQLIRHIGYRHPTAL